MSDKPDELEIWIEAIRNMQWAGAKITEIQVDKDTLLRLSSCFERRDRTRHIPKPSKFWYDFPMVQIHGVNIIDESQTNKSACYAAWDD